MQLKDLRLFGEIYDSGVTYWTNTEGINSSQLL